MHLTKQNSISRAAYFSFALLILVIHAVHASSAPAAGNTDAAKMLSERFDAFLKAHSAAPDGHLSVTKVMENPQALEALHNHPQWDIRISHGDIDQAKAHFLNAYHYCVLRILARHPDKKNVMEIPGFKDQQQCTLGGASYTLLGLETEFIRPLKDPRLIFALSWGTVGSPRIPAQVYRAETLDAALAQHIQSSLKRSDILKLEDGQWYVSSFLYWYRSDFGGDAGLKTFITPYLSDGQKQLLAKTSGEAKTLFFDWTIQ